MPSNPLAEVQKIFEPWRQAHRRDAWRAVIDEGTSSTSNFGGVPITTATHPWPACPGCGKPMRHFLQLDRTTLPVGAPLRADAGLLQLFYCTDETSTCPASEGAFEPFSQGSVVRIIDAPATTVPAAPPIGAEEPYPLHPIVGWERFDDYPATAEHELLGLKYDYDFSSGFGSSTVTVEWAERGVVFGPAPSNGLAEAIAIAESGDKLAGWPAWVQGVEYPSCPRCGATMRHVFQVDSEDHVPYMFGDMGCAHITQCPAHRDVVAFGWACG